VTTAIRLKDGETNILAGLINDRERTTMTGLPGLANIPVLGRIFARNEKEILETDIVMTLTPHILRRPEIREEDLRSFLVGGESSPLLFDVPGAPVSPAPRTEPPRIEPIRPPSPPPPTPNMDR
jgi:general secretion pathway protein D